MQVASNQPVDDVMRRWPQTIRIFLDHKFFCVGCPIATLHTVADACKAHDAELASFLLRLSEATATKGAGVREAEGDPPYSASTNSL